MPVSFSIDSENSIVYTKITGVLTSEELISGLEGLLDDPQFRPGLDGITDMSDSELDTFSIDAREIAELLVRYREKIGPSRTAVVVSKDITLGLTRMFQYFAEETSIETRIFSSIEEAREWLDESSK